MFLFPLVDPGYGQVKEKPEEASLTKGESESEEPLLDIVLVLDNSGSMKKNDPQFLTREVVTNFVNGLGEDSRLGMVIFDQEARLAEPLNELTATEAKATFLMSLDKVNYKGQFTNSPAGIERAIYELKTNARKDVQKVIIFLTDGIVDTGDKAKDLEKEKWLKEDLAQESKLEGIRIFGVAFTDKADFRLIQTLALKTEGEYFRAYKAEDIQDVFQKINAIITQPPPKPEVPITQVKEKTPTPVTAQPVSHTPAPIQPSKEKKVISIPLIIAGLAVLLGILILFFVFKGKSKPQADEIRPAAQTPKDEPPMPEAQLMDTKNVVSDQPLELNKRSITIGRETNNDVTIPKETVSGFHATIEYKNGYFYLEDQRSANGTSLNDRKIEANKEIRLKSGDRIKFDIYEFTFFIPGQAPIGKTVLTGGQAVQQSEGTVLRTSKPEKEPSEPAQEKQPEDKKPESPPVEPVAKEPNQKIEPEAEPPGQDLKTRLKSGMCPNHASMRAAEICSVCKNAFCKKCMTEKEGKAVCLNCAVDFIKT
jgi:pSer/pThr/pTyr-binding forkhead associated (FHA) protein/Mg-chelatase subunit ChlD